MCSSGPESRLVMMMMIFINTRLNGTPTEKVNSNFNDNFLDCFSPDRAKHGTSIASSVLYH